MISARLDVVVIAKPSKALIRRRITARRQAVEVLNSRPLAYTRGNAPASWGRGSYNIEQIEIASTDNVAYTGGYMSRKIIIFWNLS
jgi:hypothetical protein